MKLLERNVNEKVVIIGVNNYAVINLIVSLDEKKI